MATMNHECQRGENTNEACCGSCETDHQGFSHEVCSDLHLQDSAIYVPGEGSGAFIPHPDSLVGG